MDNEFKIELTEDKVRNLKFYAELLNKDINTILDEALTKYFEEEEERLIAKDQSSTTFDYDEFWDSVDLDD
ncbi:MAG: Unknown protein [uncultured Sulfurovum sp.]|uniref:Uncharacterized protein n=1 Tax=uncultured Sulfurovum sp. TaxID=269237 RepID=A0A6S6TVX1_9BACT|nr:MAG: Unknown protein [uncultured Sulfurovum sp.]